MKASQILVVIVASAALSIAAFSAGMVFTTGMAPQAVNLNQGDMPVTVPGGWENANGIVPTWESPMSMSGGAEDMQMPITMFRKQKQTVPKDANVMEMSTEGGALVSSDFVVLTSGPSCAAAGLTAITDATECKAANVAASGITVASTLVSALNQARKDEPHGCVRNCWLNPSDCAGARLDMNVYPSGNSESCSTKLRCVCKKAKEAAAEGRCDTCRDYVGPSSTQPGDKNCHGDGKGHRVNGGETCPHYKNIGFCSHHSWVQSVCPRTCGFCTPGQWALTPKEAAAKEANEAAAKKAKEANKAAAKKVQEAKEAAAKKAQEAEAAAAKEAAVKKAKEAAEKEAKEAAAKKVQEAKEAAAKQETEAKEAAAKEAAVKKAEEAAAKEAKKAKKAAVTPGWQDESFGFIDNKHNLPGTPVNGKSLEECIDVCKAEQDCKAFSYEKPGNGEPKPTSNCWLKDSTEHESRGNRVGHAQHWFTYVVKAPAATMDPDSIMTVDGDGEGADGPPRIFPLFFAPGECAQKCDHEPTSCEEFNSMIAVKGCAEKCADPIKDFGRSDFCAPTNGPGDGEVYGEEGTHQHQRSGSGNGMDPNYIMPVDDAATKPKPPCAEACDHEPTSCEEFKSMIAVGGCAGKCAEPIKDFGRSDFCAPTHQHQRSGSGAGMEPNYIMTVDGDGEGQGSGGEGAATKPKPPCAEACDHEPTSCEEFKIMAGVGGCAETCADEIKDEFDLC